MTDSPHRSVRTNVADRLAEFATSRADEVAVAFAQAGKAHQYETITFADLQEQSSRIARGLVRSGISPGTRMALLVPFGIDFIRIVLGMLKAGVVQVLVDPGMGKDNLIQCLSDTGPEGFIGIPKAQLARLMYRKRFPDAKHNYRVGGRWGIGGTSFAKLEALGNDESIELPHTNTNDLAAIIFTTGSTGPPKGVAYTHGTFDNQVRLIQQYYGIEPGTVDLACFPLFGLFDAVMGVTTVIPDMDPTKPADVDPQNILAAIDDWKVTQAFGSPALWHTVTSYCLAHHTTIPGVRRVLSAGAPVPPQTLASLRQIVHPDAIVCTPYGATESLPVASIESRVVLNETANRSIQGAGTCVGYLFPEMQWKVIEIDDGPLAQLSDVREMPQGEIGELMVCGPVVTQHYLTREDQNAIHKVQDEDCVWHRIGDVGYLDEHNRFWFCGRKSHRVETPEEVLFTVRCEAIFNQHPCVYRSALVGIGERPDQKPVIVIEPESDARPESGEEQNKLIEQLLELAAHHPETSKIRDVRVYPTRLPVDIRHNSKIFREKLALWATQSRND